MEQIENRLISLEKKVDEMSVIMKRLYMIFLAAVILTILGLIIPLIGLAFVIPQFIASYSTVLQ